MEQKKNNNLIIVLGLIIAILMLIIGFLLGKLSDNENKKQTEQKDDSSNLKATEVIELDINKDILVIEANSIIPNGLCGFEYFPFKEKDITINDLTDEDKLEMVYRRFVNYDPEVTVSIKEWEIQKYFEDLSFLEKVKNTKVDFDAGSMTYKNDLYIINAYPTGCEGAGEGYRKKIIKATKSNDKLEITYAYYYMTYDYVNEKYQLYNKLNDQKPIYDNVDLNENLEYVIEGKKLDYTKFNNYVLTFDIKDNNLRFEKMIYNKA